MHGGGEGGGEGGVHANLRDLSGHGDAARAMTYANGDVYEGEWRRGRRLGRGILTRADGHVQIGLWRNDELHQTTRVKSTTTARGVEVDWRAPFDVAEWERTDDEGMSDFQQRPRSPASNVVTGAEYKAYMRDAMEVCLVCPREQ